MVSDLRSLLVIGLLFPDSEEIKNILYKEISDNFGIISEKTDIKDFPSNYYNNELGEGVKRQWLLMEKIVSREQMADIKLKAIEIEDKYRKNGKRIFNIDPGFLTLSSFFLPTTKDYSHRIYLKDGIFAEITLIYKQEKFQILPWTYRDYQWEYTHEIFSNWRKKLL